MRLYQYVVIGIPLIVAFTISTQAADRPNVLFIVADDLRDTVGCYGNAVVKTPNIDRLAARGVRFDHAYVQYPVCNASRTSFLTGLRCEQTGVVDNRTFFRSRLPDAVTFPQLLRQNGWYAASFGKIFHVGEVPGEVRDGWMDLGKSWDEAKMFGTLPAGREAEGRNMTGGKLPWCRWAATAGSDDDQPDGQTARHAEDAIKKQTAAGQPWMLAAGFHRPHDPFISPKKYFDMYPPDSLSIYHDPADATPLRRLSISGGAFAEAFQNFADKDRQEFLRAYYAGVSFMDAQVGRLLDALDEQKLWDNTIVIFIGDHGYHHNERGWWSKNTLFERCCRVPCIVAAPGGKRGAACGALVELVDLYPTVAEYCGTSVPHALAGESLKPLLENPEATGKAAAFTLVARGGGQYGQAVRTKRWRYVQWSDGSQELYDELSDPQEVHDLSDEPAQANVIKELKREIARIGPFQASDAKRAKQK
jgi:uncharacterized sulfatase